jgi:dTDP-4-amino-4,6-dideoxygalactose transaminase
MRARAVSDGSVPLLDLSAQNGPLAEPIREAILRVVASGHFILGEEVTAFETEVARYLGVRHAIGVSSGTDALLVALMALGVGHGDEVITTPFSFFATAGCVARLGAIPVFVDIDAETFNIDAGQVQAAITPKTRAVIPVHLFGQAADLTRLARICAESRLPMIEDAAQSLGATFDHDGVQRRVGTVGALGCYSFFPSKNLGCFGDGGLVTTDDDDLAKRVRMLRAHGSEPKYYHHVIGGNFRLDAIQAAVLRVKLPHLDRWTDARRANAARYDRMFAEAALPQARLRTPRRAHDGHGYNQYTISTNARDGLREHLHSRRIGSEVYYPLPLHLQPCFAYLGQRKGSFPCSERAAAEVLALPIYAELGVVAQRRVADTVLDYLRVV